MRLENVVAVTGGRLLNTPSISRFDSVALLPSKATRGSLFVAHDTDEIEEALKNGAYGIITDKQPVVTDDEVAWIHVKNLDAALARLLRLWLVINPRKFLFVPPMIMEFLHLLVSDHEALLLPAGTLEASEKILASKEEQIILCDDTLFLERIGASVMEPKKKEVDFTLVSDHLFESSFILDGVYHERVPLAGPMRQIFKEAVGLLEAWHIRYTLSRLAHTPSFMPVFVDIFMNPVPFGSGEQVFVFCSDSLPADSFAYLNRIKWTESKLFLPTQIKFQCDIKMERFLYENEMELLDSLHTPLKPGFYIFAGMKSDYFFDLVGTTAEKTTVTKGLF